MQTTPFKLEFTKHGSIRNQQRGFKTGDTDIIAWLGTTIGDDQIFMSNKDADREIRLLKGLIKTIDRIRNRKFVIKGNKIVTCHHCNKSNVKRFRHRKCWSSPHELVHPYS